MKPLLNNELVLEEYDTKKWSVRKVRRRGTHYKSTQKNENKDVMIFGGNTGSVLLDTISSDDDSTISDDGGTDG